MFFNPVMEYQDFLARLREWCKRRRGRQTFLARRARVPRRDVSRMLKGAHSNPRLVYTVAVLFTRTDPVTKRPVVSFDGL